MEEAADPKDFVAVEPYIPQAWSAKRIFGIILLLFTCSAHILLIHLGHKRRRERHSSKREKEKGQDDTDQELQLDTIFVPLDITMVAVPDSAPPITGNEFAYSAEMDV